MLITAVIMFVPQMNDTTYDSDRECLRDSEDFDKFDVDDPVETNIGQIQLLSPRYMDAIIESDMELDYG